MGRAWTLGNRKKMGPREGQEEEGDSPMMIMRMIRTTTPIMILSLMLFHHILFLIFVAPLLNCCA